LCWFCWFCKLASLGKVSIAFASRASNLLFGPFLKGSSDSLNLRPARCSFLQWWPNLETKIHYRPLGPIWHCSDPAFIGCLELSHIVVLMYKIRDLYTSVRQNPDQGMLTWFSSYLPNSARAFLVLEVHCLSSSVVVGIY